MEFYIAILCFLAVLAVLDLFVGVSNDAINFVSSAIGSRAASLRTIMIVASLGVLLGATFSDGMMSIARTGVFNPEFFSFHDLMFVFFAVVCADILLLNTFNAFGLPTSTTVSVVCELLGGATAAAAVKLFLAGGSLLLVEEYINTAKVFSIISAILSSVVVAFLAGLVVQFLTRLVFTFDYRRMYRRAGGLFAALALTVIFHFLVVKGARGSVLMTPWLLDLLEAHTATILLVLFLVLAVVFQLLVVFVRVDIFRVVILAGTFALAFSFAGNDLVNFVGVPLAALDSYRQFGAVPGAVPELFTMEGLHGAVQTPTLFLLLAGLVMVVTLWFSRSAHNVIRTAINLSSANAEREQFGSSRPGRMIVRSGLAFGRALQDTVPAPLLAAIARRMERPDPRNLAEKLPFDRVRAAINLIVASCLIAIATSLCLPLSTTYVCVMVAMGSSLADGAWDRESAVYRVTGVLAVVSGWFLTALSAFTICAAITALVMLGGTPAIVLFMALVAFVVVRSAFRAGKERSPSVEMPDEKADTEAIRRCVRDAIVHHLAAVIGYLDRALAAFFAEDSRSLARLRAQAVDYHDEVVRWRSRYHALARGGDGSKACEDACHIFYRVATNIREVAYQLRLLVAAAEEHVANQHQVHPVLLQTDLRLLVTFLQELQRTLEDYLARDSLEREDILRTSNTLSERINLFQLRLLRRIDAEGITPRSSEICMAFLQFAREVIDRCTMEAIMWRHLDRRCGRAAAGAGRGGGDEAGSVPASRLSLMEDGDMEGGEAPSARDSGTQARPPAGLPRD